MSNTSLRMANKNKNDEFYTQLSDIENELKHYKDFFKGKVVLCNCDDPRVSNFFHYFSYNFEYLGLKKLITTCYKNQDADLFSQNKSERAIYLEYTGEKDGGRVPTPEAIGIKLLKGDGDFRSPECIELLKQADIVITNPPFSLFREYIAQLIEYHKQFIIIGNKNAITYKEIFKLIKENKLWLGYTTPSNFLQPDGTLGNLAGLTRWFTNVDISKRYERLDLYKKYTPTEYPKYDNYDAIEVSKVSDIPVDYDGVMGVPITFLDKYNPNQFEIVGITKTWFGGASKTYPKQVQVDKNGNRKEVGKLNDGATLELCSNTTNQTYYEVDGKKYIQLYARILIKKKVTAV